MRREKNQAGVPAEATAFACFRTSVAITLDWTTQLCPNGEIVWKAKRSGQPDLIVELRQDGSTWHVTQFTERNGNKRARQRATGEMG